MTELRSSLAQNLAEEKKPTTADSIIGFMMAVMTVYAT